MHNVSEHMSYMMTRKKNNIELMGTGRSCSHDNQQCKSEKRNPQPEGFDAGAQGESPGKTIDICIGELVLELPFQPGEWLDLAISEAETTQDHLHILVSHPEGCYACRGNERIKQQVGCMRESASDAVSYIVYCKPFLSQSVETTQQVNQPPSQSYSHCTLAYEYRIAGRYMHFYPSLHPTGRHTSSSCCSSSTPKGTTL